ncbi:hypothetical protein [Streptomyces sp. NPDC101165]|uniref:hypothetical protein n=1 Tax=Streptomyces sp. NPDC101165 TaxID=3366119 RepID=UPI0037F589B0
MSVTSVPSRNRRVACASAAKVIQPSGRGVAGYRERHAAATRYDQPTVRYEATVLVAVITE